ncbi:hypothetical protein CH63R_09231 [Colletotrichum higginsianum IMI 349063]|uniref:Uncharacterized protein n=1 Tax=Colletotrichum higginsianum (strain IMI 349063) TaxID=759273 RepID=A0A1B7Y6P0_COLHI|nr:hypothetical protein CH63R_09231 [Colletotrichum higginsianum IMI 349063]OBR07710.1 hypothetical protein CH63R_09231 [Colletotrichum higginsianum IMI 349063]
MEAKGEGRGGEEKGAEAYDGDVNTDASASCAVLCCVAPSMSMSMSMSMCPCVHVQRPLFDMETT